MMNIRKTVLYTEVHEYESSIAGRNEQVNLKLSERARATDTMLFSTKCWGTTTDTRALLIKDSVSLLSDTHFHQELALSKEPLRSFAFTLGINYRGKFSSNLHCEFTSNY